MKRTLIALLLASAAAVLAAPTAASAADVLGFSNSAQITIPTDGSATPSPSTIHVDGLRGPVKNVQVGLIGVTHAHPQDLDILLVPPDGHGAVLMSDACGTQAVNNYTWIFNSAGNLFVPSMGDSCPGTFYRATNLPGEPDAWPGVGPGDAAYSMEDWNHRAMNGDWKLYVVDDHYPYSGKIANGWTLQFTMGSVDAFVPAVGTSGVADHYPVNNSILVPGNVSIKDVNVHLSDVAADRASDLDLILQGPQGETVMLMAGACGGAPIDNPYMSFDQQA